MKITYNKDNNTATLPINELKVLLEARNKLLYDKYMNLRRTIPNDTNSTEKIINLRNIIYDLEHQLNTIKEL